MTGHSTLRTIAIASLLLVPSVSVVLSVTAAEDGASGRAISIREFLTFEGELDVAAARRAGDAVIDLTGFSLEVDAEQTIRAIPSEAPIDGVSGSESWWPGFAPGLSTSPNALAVYQGDLYAGGTFTTFGGGPGNRIARFDGTSWQPIGSGMNEAVNALALWNGLLIVAGTFNTANGVSASRIASWNGTSFSALGAGTNTTIRTLAVYQTLLIAGGDFTTAGGNAAIRIASWNGSTWSPLGSGVGNGTVRTLAAHNSDLFVGGTFTQAGGMSAIRVARWDGSAWHTVGAGLDNTVSALFSWNGSLYAGGDFLQSGTTPKVHIARWDGSAWQAVPTPYGDGFPDPVRFFGLWNGDLVVSGGPNEYEGHGVPMRGVASYNGTEWTQMGRGLSGVGPIVEYDAQLVIGSGQVSNRDPANGVHRWNGIEWQALGPAVNDWVYTIEPYAGGHVVGGLFSSVDQQPANSIAHWNGTGWTALGDGIDGVVYCAAVLAGNLYVGGYFKTAGAVQTNHIARWDGSTWHALGSGMDGMVRTLAVHGSAIHAGGTFTHAGGVPANHVARWNGTSWNALGSGTDGNVHALHSAGATLVAGGRFDHAGGGVADNLAGWNGTVWSEYGGGTNGSVYALASFGGGVVAGGYFTQAGVQTVTNIASWNGSTWTPLGSGLNHAVRTLEAAGTRLVAGGYFSGSGATPLSFVADWDGLIWRGFASGANNEVRAIAATGSGMLMGGLFRTAGGIPSPYFARWDGTLPIPESDDPSGPDEVDGTGGSAVSGAVDSANVTLLSFVPISDYDPWVPEVWGYADASGEYALLCQGNALTVVDVTDPVNPVIASKVPSVGVDLKDVQTYSHYAYCVNQFGYMQVIDLSDPYGPRTVGMIGDPASTHTCCILPERGLLFASGSYGGGVEIYDLSADPVEPPLLSRYGFFYFHDVHAVGNVLMAFAIGNDVNEFIDISDPAHPTSIHRFSHLAPIAPHSGWMTPDLSTAFTCDETAGGHVISWDISDLTNPIPLDEYQVSSNISVHNVHLEGGFLYVSYYDRGLRVLDVTDPANMVEIGHWESPAFESFGCWGAYLHPVNHLIYFTNMIGEGAGLYVAKLNNAPTSVGETSGVTRLDLAAWPNPASDSVFLRPVGPTGRKGSTNLLGIGSAGQIRVFDSGGRMIRRLDLAMTSDDGVHEWNGRDDRGIRAPSGRYYISWQVGDRRVTRSITLTR